ncbi:MAG: hypothetical protein IJW59_02305 [Clostridia bacterium]|nr:hypothetical protein [Clostridia bacterium]
MKFIFFLLIMVIGLSGCGHSQLESMIFDNISEVREFVLFGEDEKLSASLMCGRRESDYVINGYHTSLVDFGVVTITLGDNVTKDFKRAQYILYVGTEIYKGDFEINPYDETLVADIKKIIDKSENVSVDVILDKEKISSLKLKNVDKDWIITCNDCINILSKTYKKELKSLIRDGEFWGEVYVKIITDRKAQDVKNFFFYANVVGRSGENLSMVICPFTGEVLASNCNINLS